MVCVRHYETGGLIIFCLIDICKDSKHYLFLFSLKYYHIISKTVFDISIFNIVEKYLPKSSKNHFGWVELLVTIYWFDLFLKYN